MALSAVDISMCIGSAVELPRQVGHPMPHVFVI